jgi:hypothetical protein
MNKDLMRLAYKLKKFNKKFVNKRLRYVTKRDVSSSKFSFFTHFLLHEDFSYTPYRNILINYFKKAETLYPGSSYFVSVGLVDKICGVNNKSKKTLSNRTLDSFIRYLCELVDEKTVDRFIDILKFSGPNSTITCTPTKNIDIVVEKSSYPKISIPIDESFRNMYFSTIKSATKNVIFSVIDGFIERESEVMPLLEESRKHKLPVVIVCRGISDSAKRNLKQIALKNSIYVYPYVCKFNNEDPFILKDINDLAGTSILSAEFGDAIYKDVVSKSEITKIKLSSNSITFYNSSDKLVLDINKQLKSCNESVKPYLQKRKSRSAPNNIEIKVPVIEEKLLNDLKRLIVCYNYCAINGFYTLEDDTVVPRQCSDVSETMSARLYNTLNSIGLVVKLNTAASDEKTC